MTKKLNGREEGASLRELTPSQLTLMKCIWDANREMSYQELINLLEEQYGREYQRSTVITFLRQLTDRGYVDTYRIGKYAYVRPVVTEEMFQREHARTETNRWYKGRVSNFVSAFANCGGIDKEDIQEIRRLLDELEQMEP